MPTPQQAAGPRTEDADPAGRGAGMPFVLLEDPQAMPETLHAAQTLIEALPIPMFFKDRAGSYRGVNRAWEEFFGVPREEFLGKQVRDLYPQSPETADRHRLMDEELWQRPGRQSYEIQVSTRDGHLRDTIY